MPKKLKRALPPLAPTPNQACTSTLCLTETEIFCPWNVKLIIWLVWTVLCITEPGRNLTSACQREGEKTQLLRNVESVCIFGRGYQPDMSADSIHRAGRLKMSSSTTNTDFTTESSTLTFILAPFDMTWWAGLGWSTASCSSHHPPTAGPALQPLCPVPSSPSWKKKDIIPMLGLFAVWRSAPQLMGWRQDFHLVLTEGTLRQTMATSASQGGLTGRI